MAERQRSPFGELVRNYRRGLNYSQRGLIDHMHELAESNPDVVPVVLRTLSRIEGQTSEGERQKASYKSTVRSLAFAFGLTPGTPAWKHFIRLSQLTSNETAPEEASEGPLDAALIEPNSFVAAGRTRPLARITAAINNTVTFGRSGFLLVHASAGTGKTSLVANAVRQALQQHPSLVALWGSCTEVAASSLQPFQQAISGMIAHHPHRSPASVISVSNPQRLAARRQHALQAIVDEGRGLVENVVPADVLTGALESRTLDPTLAASLAALIANPGSTPDVTGIHVQVSRLLALYARQGPVVLVLDDLHWSDPATIALLGHLLRYIQGQNIPILVIGTYRPAEFNLRPTVQAALRESSRLFSNASIDLSSAIGGNEGYEFTRAYIAAAIDNPPQSLIDTVFAITDGHPFTVDIVLRIYFREGALSTNEDGLFTWLKDPDNLPTELNDLFGNLIDRMPADLYSLIQVASVQGSTFYAEILREALGVTNTELIGLLDERLVRRLDVVRPAEAIAITGKRLHGYELGHALFRDYIYHQLPAETRARYHLATAQAYIAFFGPMHAATATVVAFHFEQADHLAEAAAYFHLAGDAALDRYDYARAFEMFTHNTQLDQSRIEPFHAAQALVGLGNCARGTSEATLAREYFERALVQATRLQLPKVLASAHTSLGMIFFDTGDMQLGADHLRLAIDQLYADGNLVEASRSLTLLSHVLHGTGQYDDAATAADTAIALATELHHDTLLVGGYIALGNCYYDIGQYAHAIQIYQRGLGIAEEQGNTHRMVLCLLNISLCHIESRQWERATADLAHVFDLRAQVTRRLFSAADFNMALVDEAQGRIRDANAGYQSSLDLRHEHTQWALAIDSQAGLVRTAMLEQRLEDLPERLALIQEHLAAHGNDGIEHPGRLYLTLAQAHTALGDTDRTHEALTAGIATITARHQLLEDAGRRASYLYNVPSHKMLLELATRSGIAVPNESHA